MARPDASGDAEGLARALATIGLAVGVEPRGALVVLSPSADAWRALDAAGRRDIITRAREHGFSHAALEIPDAL